jgi:hypothetical protein
VRRMRDLLCSVTHGPHRPGLLADECACPLAWADHCPTGRLFEGTRASGRLPLRGLPNAGEVNCPMREAGLSCGGENLTAIRDS